jgi:RimJ/RimL family protein N-acetyltransferase
MTEFKNRFSWLRRRSVDDDEAERQGDELYGGSHLDDSAPIREGRLVDLRRHIPENRAAFQRWYADQEIATLLRHDQRPLNEIQSRGYFDTIILPMSARGTCYAIHEKATGRFIGSSALTDFIGSTRPSALFRIVIGEKDCWGKGYGTEATRLAVAEAFDRHNCGEVRLEVFRHNQRAISAYERVGFQRTGSHTEWVGREHFELHVIEMAISPEAFAAAFPSQPGHLSSTNPL